MRSDIELKRSLLKSLDEVEAKASMPKILRFFTNPFKYINSVFYREFIYKRSKKTKDVLCSTFFKTPMFLKIPSGTDIYLTGGKSHDSEIRLARYLIINLKPGDCFVDIGAHYGYFSLLASKLTGPEGSVFSFEASPANFEILFQNTKNHSNIEIHNRAVSDTDTPLSFYEFPNLYSEYNSMNIKQFQNEPWFSEYKPDEVRIEAVIPGDFLINGKIYPRIIKIDVEGAEYKVISGLKDYLKNYSSVVVMEYLSEKRGNIEHIKAEELLRTLGFLPFLINKDGQLKNVSDIPVFLAKNNVDSDNIVFVKKRN